MSPFQWLREQVAQSVLAGWQDGFRLIEESADGRLSTLPSKGEPVAKTVPTVGQTSSNGAEPPPLAGLVERLRLTSNGTPSSASSQARSVPQTRKPPRKHD